MDSTYEDVDACWTDVNNDGNPDLVVASGGNEYFGHDSILTPRIYLGDGKGNLNKMPHPFDSLVCQRILCRSPRFQWRRISGSFHRRQIGAL